MMRKIEGIQVLRGILFILILCFHCGISCAALGWGGVESFFVISSFFLTKKMLLTENDLSIKKYILQRIGRLYPPYILVLALAAVYSIIILKQVPADFVVFVFSLQNLMWIKTGYISPMQPLTAHTWTLSIEIWMGLIWFALLKKFHSKKTVRVICILSIIIAIFVRSLSIWMRWGALFITLFPFSHIDAFGIGGLLALNSLREYDGKEIIKQSAMTGVIGAGGIMLSMWKMAKINGIEIQSSYFLWKTADNYMSNIISGNIYLYLSIITFSVLNILLIFTKNKVGLILKPLALLGNVSYKMYLFHWPILFICANHIFLQKIPYYISLITYFFLALVITWLFDMIKKTFLREKQR